MSKLENVVFPDLKAIYAPDPSKPGIDKQDVARWSSLTGLSTGRLYREIALYVASGFHHSELSFEFCDAVMNDLFGVMVCSKGEFSDLASEVYDAFDQGEFYHKDRTNDDPIETFTRPMIALILSGTQI